jgi:hypothetical protein
VPYCPFYISGYCCVQSKRYYEESGPTGKNHFLSSPMQGLYGIISRFTHTVNSNYECLQIRRAIWLQEIP